MLAKFSQYLHSEKRFSQHTHTAYVGDIEQFLDFAEVQTPSDLKEVNHQLIRSWIVELSEQNSNRTINRKLAALRAFFTWSMKNQLIDHNPLKRIRGPRQDKKLPVFAKESEVLPEKLELIFPNTFSGLRDRLIFETFYQTGIRLSELIELSEDQIYDRHIKVIGKRKKERLIPISEELRKDISNYEQQRRRLDPGHSYLFVLDNGKKLYPKFVYRKINHYLGLAASLDVNSPHVLRHTFATHLLNNGAGLESLKDLLGHASLAATQVYTHNSFAELTNIYSSAHPRGSKKN
ncbi:MAG: integrase [Bacteroidetes bacterium]|nr:MAG: integrase [Bacteroidota bacterium]